MTAQPQPAIAWVQPGEVPEVAAFFAGAVQGDPRYISHSEIQLGLSPDGERWIDDLAGRYAEDFADPGPHRRIAIARAADGQLLAAGVLNMVEREQLVFGVLEDMTVSPAARSTGIGTALMAFLEAAAKESGASWCFLESGLHNERAHGFFDRNGYRTISKVFGKRI